MANPEKDDSVGFGGGAFGDEGKGKLVDAQAMQFFGEGKEVVVYRPNGGPNAGHNVEFEDKRFVFHQLPSGVFIEGATVILGRGMVIHPADLVEEIEQAEDLIGHQLPARVLIDVKTPLALDTHRAFEFALKQSQEGGRGATGRGIAPAYADILLRQALRVEDLVDEKKLKEHYQLYQKLMAGLGLDLKEITVPTLAGEKAAVGTEEVFVRNLISQAEKLGPYQGQVFDFLQSSWPDERKAFVFEMAQAVGLDSRFGVYPDVTASDCTFGGIFSATEGIVDPRQIKIRAGVIKATYMSSVGSRRLPTRFEDQLAVRIREDAHEYGATTKRPRGIAWLDLPALKFFARAGDFTHLAVTHLDIAYPDAPILVCVEYHDKKTGQKVGYRPYQDYLDGVDPVYKEFKPWEAQQVRQARNPEELPEEAKDYLRFLSDQLELPFYMVTTGPKREQGFFC